VVSKLSATPTEDIAANSKWSSGPSSDLIPSRWSTVPETTEPRARWSSCQPTPADSPQSMVVPPELQDEPDESAKWAAIPPSSQFSGVEAPFSGNQESSDEEGDIPEEDTPQGSVPNAAEGFSEVKRTRKRRSRFDEMPSAAPVSDLDGIPLGDQGLGLCGLS